MSDIKDLRPSDYPYPQLANRDSAGCAPMPGYVPDDVVKAAYIELMEGPIPQTRTGFRRAVMLAVIIGRELEDRSRAPGDESPSNT